MGESHNPRLAVPQRLPRYLEALNALAVAHGLTVSMVVEPYERDPEIRLWCKWTGKRDAALRLIQPIPSYHLPMARGLIAIPGGSTRVCQMLIGEVTVNGDDVLLEFDCGSTDFTIAARGEVEVITYADEILYHGSAAALLALGIGRNRLPLEKRDGKKGGYHCWNEEQKVHVEVPQWSSSRQPDGLILYREETAGSVERRCRERKEYDASPRARTVLGLPPLSKTIQKPVRPSFLRLIVDNTKPGKDTQP
jgi:hypothetical protein